MRLGFAAFAAGFRSPLGVIREVPAAAPLPATLLTVVSAFSLLLAAALIVVTALVAVVVILVALLASFDVLFAASTLVRHVE